MTIHNNRIYRLSTHMTTKRKIITWNSFISNKLNAVLLEMLNYNDEIIVSLEEINYISCGGLIWLLFISLIRLRNQKRTSFIFSNNGNLLRYIKSTNFVELQNKTGFRIIDDYMLKILKDSTFLHGSDGLHDLFYVNCTNFDLLTREIELEVCKFLDKILGSNDKYPFYRVFLRTFQEIVSNIILHSGSDNKSSLGEGLISIVSLNRRNEYIHYSFCDIGKGFLNSFKEKHGNKELSTENDAVMEGFLFRFKHQDQGILGMYHILGLISDFKGSISIRSRNQLINFDFSNKDRRKRFSDGYHKHICTPSRRWLNQISTSKTNLLDIPGVHINIRIPLH